MIRERSLLEIEMYKRARQQFCSRGYVLPFFYCFLKPVGKIFFFHWYGSYLQNQPWVSVSRVLPLPTQFVPNAHRWRHPALLRPWGSQRGAEMPEVEGAARVKMGDTKYCTLTPLVEGAFHPRGLSFPCGFPE